MRIYYRNASDGAVGVDLLQVESRPRPAPRRGFVMLTRASEAVLQISPSKYSKPSTDTTPHLFKRTLLFANPAGISDALGV